MKAYINAVKIQKNYNLKKVMFNLLRRPFFIVTYYGVNFLFFYSVDKDGLVIII